MAGSKKAAPKKKSSYKPAPKTADGARAHYDRRNKTRWDGGMEKFKAATKAASDGKAHAFRGLTGVLGRYCRADFYRVFGYVYLGKSKSKRRRDVYDQDELVLADRLETIGRGRIADRFQRGAAYRYSYQLKHNFLEGFLPYRNQAHHVIPVEAFEKAFVQPKHRRILKVLPYDLNHGANIIFLPEAKRYSPVHRLVSHQGSHDRYSGLVVADLKLQARNLEMVDDPCRKGKNPPGESIVNGFIQTQDDYWWLIVGWGELVCTLTINEAAAEAGSLV